jgi:hypothetical protein
MTMLHCWRWSLIAIVAMAGCGTPPSVPVARADTVGPPARPASTPLSTHVDSVVPREKALARFQQGSRPVTALSGGAGSRNALVRLFARALEAGDTTALRRLVLSRAEFAWLYYPTSAQGRPPYDLSPELMWFMMVERSNRGLAALLTERTGRPLATVGYRCLGDSTVEGANRLWGPCLVRHVQAPGDTVEERLFGPIIGRGHRFKFVSYSNKLD